MISNLHSIYFFIDFRYFLNSGSQVCVQANPSSHWAEPEWPPGLVTSSSQGPNSWADIRTDKNTLTHTDALANCGAASTPKEEFHSAKELNHAHLSCLPSCGSLGPRPPPSPPPVSSHRVKQGVLRSSLGCTLMWHTALCCSLSRPQRLWVTASSLGFVHIVQGWPKGGVRDTFLDGDVTHLEESDVT